MEQEVHVMGEAGGHAAACPFCHSHRVNVRLDRISAVGHCQECYRTWETELSGPADQP